MNLMVKILMVLTLLFGELAHAKKSIQHTRIVNDGDTNQAHVNTDNDLTVTDTPNTSGLDKVFNLTTTAQELKVGATAKTNRKYIYMEALTNRVKWGFNTSCNFSLAKRAFFSLPVGQNVTVYLCAESGTASIVGGEL